MAETKRMLKTVLVEVENVLNRLIISLIVSEEAAGEENVTGNREKENSFMMLAEG